MTQPVTPAQRFLARIDEPASNAYGQGCKVAKGIDEKLRFSPEVSQPDELLRVYAWRIANDGEFPPYNKRVVARDWCHRRCIEPAHMRLVDKVTRAAGGRKGTKLGVWLDPDVHLALELAVKANGLKKRDLVNDALRRFLPVLEKV